MLEDARAQWAKREEELTPEVTRQLERRVVLSVLDRKWREHLYEMDYLKEGIGLRAMAQRDPLVEYQREGFDMFAAMLDSLKEESVGYLYNLQVQVVPAEESQQAEPPAQDGSGNGSGNGRALPPPKPGGGKEAAVRRRMRPVEALPTQQAEAAKVEAAKAQAAKAGTAKAGTPNVETSSGNGAAEAGSATPAALRAKGLSDARPQQALSYSGPTEDGGVQTSGQRKAGGRATATSAKEPARNAPCPCGSGKKYKLCHGRPGSAN